MSNVLAIMPKAWKKDDGTEVTTYWITLDDRTEDLPCYDDKAAELKLREPLPEGWEVKKSAKGKDYLATPKAGRKGGFEAAYRNTKDGQFYEQERMDRRTAVMQAVAMGGFDAKTATGVRAMLESATDLYEWLRKTSGGVGPSTPPDTSVVAPAINGEVEGGSGALGEGGSDSPEAVHIHDWQPAPRDGWVMCSGCGLAELARKAKV